MCSAGHEFGNLAAKLGLINVALVRVVICRGSGPEWIRVNANTNIDKIQEKL